MTLKLYYHPLASFCWKALIALYENGTQFEAIAVDLADADASAAFRAVWPMGKFPVLRDDARDCTVAESTAVIEYLDSFYAGPSRLVPDDPDRAWRVRMWDRVLDNFVHEPMQKIVTDTLRPEGKNDAVGVEKAKETLHTAYPLIAGQLTTSAWIVGDTFTLADCSAAPALFYANLVVPFEKAHPRLAAYLDRLTSRRSFARVLREAEPYFAQFPMERKPQIRNRDGDRSPS